jgi:thymidylate synthase (FAD)
MKLIKPKFEIGEQAQDVIHIKNIYEAIEAAGRTCDGSIGTRYFMIPLGGAEVPSIWHDLKLDCTCEKSLKIEGSGIKNPKLEKDVLNGYVSIADKDVAKFPGLEKYESPKNSHFHRNITAESFVDELVKSHNNSLLEFGTVYLKYELHSDSSDYDIFWDDALSNYKNNHFSKYTLITTEDNKMQSFVTTNYRVLVENDWLDDLQYLCTPTEHHLRRIYAKFITDTGTANELLKYRAFSFARENNINLKNELTFILPSFIDINDADEGAKVNRMWNIDLTDYSSLIAEENPLDKKADYFLYSIESSEYAYLNMLKYGFTPQQAMQVLPNALKAEINMCGFISDWKHFFATTDMHDLATLLRKKFIEKGFDKNYAI